MAPRVPVEDRSDRGVRLRWHVLALALALAAVWPVLRLDGAFTVDEGSYAVQARVLAEGTWDMGYAFSAADPEGRFVPYHGAALVDGEVVPYAKHPAVPMVLRLAAVPFGEQMGFRALGVASVLALAAAAWSIAGELGPRRARPWAFWVAAASPALANAWVVWPHAPSAALGALVVLAALRVTHSWWWLPVAGSASAAGVLARAEGLLLAAAVAVALLVAARSSRERLAGLVVGGSALVALVGERWWRADLVSGAATVDFADRSRGAGLAGRLTGVRLALLDGAVADRAATLLTAVVLTVVVFVALRWRAGDTDGPARPAPPGLAVLWVLAAAVLAARFLVAANDPAIGLFAAAPVLLVGVAWRPVGAGGRWLVVALGSFAVAIAASTYPDGGALQWGGRFFSPLLGPLAAIAGVVLATHTPNLRQFPGVRTGNRRKFGVGWGVGVGVVLVLVVQAAGAVAIPDRMRAATDANLQELIDEGESVIVAGGRMIPRLDWRSWPERCWISLPPDSDAAATRDLLGVLAASGVESAAYAGIEPGVLRRAGASVHPDVDTPRIGILEIPDPATMRRVAPPYSCPAR